MALGALALAMALFLACAAAIGTATVQGLRFAGQALNKRRAGAARLRSGALAVVALIGLVVAAAAGFLGIGALLYYISQT